jgi:hypothetical protein
MERDGVESRCRLSRRSSWPGGVGRSLAPLIRVLAAVALGAVAILAGPRAPAQAAYSDPLTALSPSGFGLVWHATPAAAISALDAALPNVGVATVLASANHPMPACAGTNAASLPIAPAATTSLCWDSGDASTTTWTPQGVTSSGDADDDGAWGTNQVILSGWHYSLDDSRYQEARVAFINANNLGAAAYRWVYLVVPNSTGSTFTAAKAHLGGMVWYGDKLLVSAVGNGSVAIRVFSMSHILQVNDSSATIGKTSSGYAAYGYQYVMTQVGYYSYAGGTCDMSTDVGVPCYSSLSLDRSTSPDSLVTTEYFSDASLDGRLIRYPFGSDYLLQATSNSVSASEAYRSAVGNMQGVLSYAGAWYVAHSSATYRGQLWHQTTTGSTALSCTTPDTSASMCWAMHPEALSYWPSTGLVWSQSEWPDQRALFAVPLTAFP